MDSTEALYWTDGEIGPRVSAGAGRSRQIPDFDGMGSARSGPGDGRDEAGRTEEGRSGGRGRGDRGGLERVGIGPTGIGLGRWELDSTEHCIDRRRDWTERRRPEVGGSRP
ncbi:hypothetical protein TNIN_103781, partial [Trichonephila inaurata madagascariensis]